jgi:hypothetical protein
MSNHTYGGMPTEEMPGTAPRLSDDQALIATFSKDLHDRYYEKQNIYLDGYTFENCRFSNCTLITDTGMFTLRDCTFADGSVWFGPNAMKIVRLFGLYHRSPWPSMNPGITADGSVNI